MPKSKQSYLQNYSRGEKELKKGEVLYEDVVERRKGKWSDQRLACHRGGWLLLFRCAWEAFLLKKAARCKAEEGL